MKKAAFTCILLCAAAIGIPAQRTVGVRPTESGGPLSAEQASYDILSVDLAVAVDPEKRSIEGAATLDIRVVQPLRRLVLDLDRPLKVHSTGWMVDGEALPLPFQRTESQVGVEFPSMRQPGETVRVRVAYGGVPREALRPPWAGGFVWEKTADGQPWIAVACQIDGADLWWPVKDHSSDEPQRVDLHVTVPAGLFVASNGTLQGATQEPDGRQTFHWSVDNPVNAYNVTVNIAPYREIAWTYRSVTGQDVPVFFWVLPEDYEKGLKLFEQFGPQMRFLEETIGPYPFRNEKFGVAETPYLGMEHQTVIAYGNRFRDNAFGFDGLLLHELSHEWWGNLLTVTDWSDYWIHEGFASYMEALYAEKLRGPAALQEFMQGQRARIRNQDPLAPRESRSTVAKYYTPPDYVQSDGDVNAKGAWVLHSLRYLIGDEAFFESLKRFAYPDPEAAARPGRCQCRFVSSEDFIRTVESVSGRQLGWFFEVYLRSAELPRLEVRREAGQIELAWTAPDGLPFPMPVPVKSGGLIQRVEMPEGRAHFDVEDPRLAVVDPDNWVLREPDSAP